MLAVGYRRCRCSGSYKEIAVLCVVWCTFFAVQRALSWVGGVLGARLALHTTAKTGGSGLR